MLALGMLALAALPSFSPEQMKQLEAGEVLIKVLDPTGGEGVAAKVAGIVDAPPARVFPVVDECSHFHEFMPRTKKSREIYRTDSTSKCFVEISMPFPLSNLWSETVVTREKREDGVLHRHWRLDKGTYKRNSGSWTLYPWGPEGKRTLAVYIVDTAPDVPIPDAIARAAQKSSLPELITAIRARVAGR